MSDVLVVIASGRPGGGTTHVLDLVRGLRERRPIAVACGTDGDLAATLAREGVETYPIDFMRSRFAPGIWRALSRAIVATRPGIVHAHGSRAALASALALRLASGVRLRPRLVYTEHGLSFERNRGALVAIPAWLVERTVGVLGAETIALSRYSECALRRLGTYARITRIPNMVRVPADDFGARRARAREVLGLPEQVPVVGTIMRLVPQKAPERFVDLAAQVRASVSDARFVIVGDGPLRQSVERAIARAGLEGVIMLLGMRPDARELLPAFDVFALLSRWEGLPISVLEAQAAGVPVVATAVGGTAELVEAGAGFAVRDGDVERAARACVACVTDREHAGAIARRARARVEEEFTAARILARIEAVYERGRADERDDATVHPR